MKKIYIYLLLFFSIFSLFNSNLAFADSSDNDRYKKFRNIKAQNYYNESWKKLDKYNMRKTTSQDVVYDNQEGSLYYQESYNNRFDPILGKTVTEDNVNNEFHPLQSFWGAVCDQKSRKFYTESTSEKLDKACKAHYAGSKSVMSVAYQSNNTTVNAHLLIYAGKRDVKFSFIETGFYSEPLDKKEEGDFIEIFVRISLSQNWKEKTKNYNSIELSASNAEFRNINNEYRVFGLMGKQNGTDWLAFAPLYNQFNVVYPDDFNNDFKPLTDIEDSVKKKNKPKFYPYFSYKVSKMNLNGLIMLIDDKGKQPFGVSNIRPQYDLYNEDRTQRIFSYSGSTMADYFNYDFEEKGTYWVKTQVYSKPPMLNLGDDVEVIQPVWAKVVINGESYSVLNTSFDESSSTRCVDGFCETPSFVDNCAALNGSNFGNFIMCSFNKIDTKSREQFGVLYSPIQFSKDILARLSNVNAVSCNIKIQSYTASFCFIQNKTPQLYTLITIVSNGVILFGFSIYIYKQALHFFAGDGEED